MKTSLKFASSGALVALLAANPALADVTPEQVWTDFKEYFESVGYEVSGDEAVSSSTMTVSNLVLKMVQEQANTTSTVSIGQLVMTDQGDGTVSVTVPAEIPMRIVADPAEGDAADISINVAQTGMQTVVSGDPGDATYTFSANTMTVSLTNLTVEGEQLPADAAQVSVALNGMQGVSKMSVGDMRSFEQTGTVDKVTYDMSFKDPKGEGSGNFSGSVDAVTLEALGSLPLTIDPDDAAAMFNNGFNAVANFAHSGGKSSFQVEENGTTTQGNTSSQNGTFAVSIGKEGVSYSVSGTGTQLELMGGEIPFPVALAMDEFGFNFKMPLSKSDEEQDFALGVTLGQFTMSEMIWNLFDPGTVLPRDPATIAFDLTGKAKLFLDLLDEAAIKNAEMSGQMPGEVNSVSVNNLTVELAGAKLDGKGDFTFDNTDLQTFNGLPRPTGVANLMLTGGNALLDKLVQMGLLKQEDAMGARMMVSMFAVPGAGEDVLESKIEINDQGHIMANGMRIQ